MIPLSGSNFPQSLDELSNAIRDGLSAHGIAARDIRSDGGTFPKIDQLQIDLTGANVSRTSRLPLAISDPTDTVTVRALHIRAKPLLAEGTPLQLALDAQEVTLGFARDAAQRPLLMLVASSTGTVSFEANRADLENLLKTLAADAAAKQGAEIKAVRLEFTARSSKSLDLRAEITAKVFVMSTVLTVTARVEVDDELNLRARHLKATGEGMIANLAAGYLRPRFEKIESRTIPLASHAFADVQLKDIVISGTDSLRIEASFGV